MDWKMHTFGVGRLWCNLLTLEILLRYCIEARIRQGIEMPNLDTLEEGQILERTAIINCDHLSNVIQKFNSVFRDLNISIDEDRIVRLRNALGHGKVLSNTPPWPNPMKIFNLKNHDRNHVRVDFFDEMTEEWFDSNKDFLFEESKRLKELYDTLI